MACFSVRTAWTSARISAGTSASAVADNDAATVFDNAVASAASDGSEVCSALSVTPRVSSGRIASSNSVTSAYPPLATLAQYESSKAFADEARVVAVDVCFFRFVFFFLPCGVVEVVVVVRAEPDEDAIEPKAGLTTRTEAPSAARVTTTMPTRAARPDRLCTAAAYDTRVERCTPRPARDQHP